MQGVLRRRCNFVQLRDDCVRLDGLCSGYCLLVRSIVQLQLLQRSQHFHHLYSTAGALQMPIVTIVPGAYFYRVRV